MVIGVALIFLLAAGVLGYLLASSPRSPLLSGPASPSTGRSAVTGTAAPPPAITVPPAVGAPVPARTLPPVALAPPAAAGSVPAGSAAAGTAPVPPAEVRPLPAGSLPAGSLPAGSLPAGTAPAGSAPFSPLAAGPAPHAASGGRTAHPAAPRKAGAPGAAAGPGAAIIADPASAEVARKLRAQGYRVSPGGSADDVDCAANSYGATQTYLQAHPCTTMHRALVEVRAPNGGTALVAVARITMAEAASADGLRTELDRPGSGNVIALSRADQSYRSVTFQGLYYSSLRRDTTVNTAEAEPMATGLTPAQLKAIAAAAAG